MRRIKKKRKSKLNVSMFVFTVIVIYVLLTQPFRKDKEDNPSSMETALTSEFSTEGDYVSDISTETESENETQVSIEDEGEPEVQAEPETEPEESVEVEQELETESEESVEVEQEPETEPEESVEVEQEPETESEESVEVDQESEAQAQDYFETKEFQDRCRLTYAESVSEDEIGQIAVAAVVLNRQYSTEFNADGNFYNVMNNGFSSVCNGEIYLGKEIVYYENIPDETIDATKRAFNGEDPTEELLWAEALRLGLDPEKYAAGGALYFYNPKYCSEAALAERANIKCKVQIGNHVFYKVWDN